MFVLCIAEKLLTSDGHSFQAAQPAKQRKIDAGSPTFLLSLGEIHTGGCPAKAFCLSIEHLWRRHERQEPQ